MPANIYESVKQALQDVVAPELRALQVEIRRLDEKIDSLDEKIDSLRHELLSEIHRVDERINGLEKRIDTTLDLHERIAALEARVGANR